ncbi:MAG: hypothetical protein WKF84_15080 [Pyrinomonadaceae bacterium]
MLEPGHVLSPGIDLFNEEGVHLFSTYDVGEEWRRRPRPVGCYTSTMWIPGNCLTEGNLIASASVASHTPETMQHAYIRNAVSFQASESREGRRLSARRPLRPDSRHRQAVAELDD